jgi:hypothetical protein
MVLFILTVLLANIAFTYFAVSFTSPMKDLLRSVQRIRDQAMQLDLSDGLAGWISILFEPNRIVFVGLSILVWVVLAIFYAVLGSGSQRRAPADEAAPAAARGLPGWRWG